MSRFEDNGSLVGAGMISLCKVLFGVFFFYGC